MTWRGGGDRAPPWAPHCAGSLLESFSVHAPQPCLLSTLQKKEDNMCLERKEACLHLQGGKSLSSRGGDAQQGASTISSSPGEAPASLRQHKAPSPTNPVDYRPSAFQKRPLLCANHCLFLTPASPPLPKARSRTMKINKGKALWTKILHKYAYF